MWIKNIQSQLPTHWERPQEDHGTNTAEELCLRVLQSPALELLVPVDAEILIIHNLRLPASIRIRSRGGHEDQWCEWEEEGKATFLKSVANLEPRDRRHPPREAQDCGQWSRWCWWAPGGLWRVGGWVRDRYCGESVTHNDELKREVSWLNVLYREMLVWCLLDKWWYS